MVKPARVRRRAAVWLVVLALAATSACSWPGSDEPDAPHVVSYSGAAGRLAALGPSEEQEQVRDWARLGLASSLGLNHKQIVDALYDTTPIRDPLFADLVEQPTGPGRALFDGTTLHVLVPHDDPHSSRTIGLLLDEHRVDAGADPGQVQLHHYRVRPENQRIELSAQPATATGQIRAAHGWHEVRVDQPQGLADFLAATDHLSRLETRGAEVWAAGWRWLDSPSARVTVEDVAVLQRGYQQPSVPKPAFSLDPRPLSTLDDVRAAIPGLAPDLAERIISGSWAGSGFGSAAELRELVERTLLQNDPPATTLPARGLPADRTQLWALRNLLRGGAAYSHARYEGGLAGTEVGMTLFYTDYVAKDWTSGVGTGVPTDAVPGFVPDPQAATPPSLCPRPGDPLDESGRLWFGQDDTGFAFEPHGVGIGARATRLFARSHGPGGTEVEPSFRFGRGLRWWDQHYQAIADYEPQYHRLEQLMRWSGVLEWLTTRGGGQLLELPDRGIRSDLRFADWYAAHDELRERAPLTLVTPPSATEEAVLPTPSAPTRDCGGFQIAGGVSLANLLNRSRGLPSDPAQLPPGVRRAGPIDPRTTSVDPSTGSGRIDRVTLDEKGQVTDRVTRSLQREGDVASVGTVGGYRSIPFGEGRVVGEAGPRQLTIKFQSAGRDLTADVAYQGYSFGGVDVRPPPSSGVQQTDITLQRGLIELLQAATKRLHQDPTNGLDTFPDLLYQYPGPEGRTVYRFAQGWGDVGTGPTSSRTGFVVEVTTVDGRIVEVRAVTPQRLSNVDVAAVEITQAATVMAYRDMLNVIPPDAPIYADVASLVGPERAGSVPAAIPADAVVSFRLARVTGDGSSPGVVTGEGRTWSLVDRPGGGGSDQGNGGSGEGGSGAGRAVLGGTLVLVLVTACSDAEQRPGEECR